MPITSKVLINANNIFACKIPLKELLIFDLFPKQREIFLVPERLNHTLLKSKSMKLEIERKLTNQISQFLTLLPSKEM